MDAPDELRWAVAEALFDASDDLRPEDNWPDDDAKYGRAADAVLAVPAIADALRAAERDAKVAEIVAPYNAAWPDDRPAPALPLARIAALYPETGKPAETVPAEFEPDEEYEG